MARGMQGRLGAVAGAPLGSSAVDPSGGGATADPRLGALPLRAEAWVQEAGGM